MSSPRNIDGLAWLSCFDYLNYCWLHQKALWSCLGPRLPFCGSEAARSLGATFGLSDDAVQD